MKVTRFTGPTMEATLSKVKGALGPRAVILHTRTFRKGGFLGIGGTNMVEITASNEVEVPARRVGPAARQKALGKAYRRELPEQRRSQISSYELGSIQSDIAGIRTMIAELTEQTRPSRISLWPDGLKAWYKHLCRRGVSEQVAIEILEPLVPRLSGKAGRDSREIAGAVVGRLREFVSTAEPVTTGVPGRPSVVAFVGPTGVGKTTTIAKLAAHFALREKKPVGLVTLDTYRIAAVEQLRTYARIIEVPLEVVLGPADLPVALERLSSSSIIFVDTAGRSQRDLIKMNDLKNFFGRRRPDQIHLVLSATAEPAALKDIVEKFGIYKPDRVLVTKIDEMPACGRLLDIAGKGKACIASTLPVSYITTGQDVPDDIEAASPRRLAALVAGKEVSETPALVIPPAALEMLR